MRQESPVAVVGGGVVGAAVLYWLARRGVAAVLLEAEDGLALQASGTNSGILHTGFDSTPGELETRLLLRSAELLPPVLGELGIPVLHCGAVLEPRGPADAEAIRRLAGSAARNGVEMSLLGGGAVEIPGEAVTDPVAYTHALAAAAVAVGATVLTGCRVTSLEAGDGGVNVGTAGGDMIRCGAAVNCAGLRADEVAALGGDDGIAIHPRKGEFLVFAAPDQPLERIRLPIPAKRTKGVLVFPTLDGYVIAGPTAHDQEDKDDWTVRAEARDEVLAKAADLWPPLRGLEPIFSYAGLRPAGRGGLNYAIRPSDACPGLVHVAAIRSTGLSASLGIAEHVCSMLEALGVPLEADRPLAPGAPPAPDVPWWQRTARHRLGVAT